MRDELRSIGFYINEWGGVGLTSRDFDALITRGAIRIADAPQPMPSRSEPSEPDTPALDTPAPADDPTPIEEMAAAARAVLTSRRLPLSEAAEHVPPSPGLYAIYGDAQAWRELALGDPPDDRPLYVGKAEDSLVTRDLGTHFGDRGRTGSSTVRRSFAALLRDPLNLHAQPRNAEKPERCANYGLVPPGDETLTEWMREKLQLAFWPKPADAVLKRLESALLVDWLPPINLQGITTPWTRQLSDARAVMAAEARAWARERGFHDC